MKITRGWREVVLGLIALALFLCAMAVITDERCSRAADEASEIGEGYYQDGGFR